MIKARFCFVIKALQVFWLGLRIELSRRWLTRTHTHRGYSSKNMIEANNRLSLLGNKWMELKKGA